MRLQVCTVVTRICQIVVAEIKYSAGHPGKHMWVQYLVLFGIIFDTFVDVL